MSRVMIHPSEYDDCRKAVDRAFELFPIPMKGRKVLLKPNVLRGSAPDEAVTTHPALLQAVVERLEEEKPAGIVVGDNPGLASYGANEASFQTAGLVEAAKGYYRNIGQDSAEVPFNPAYAPQVSVSKAVLDADVVISLPKFKTHGLTIMTGAIKNSYGILPGALKAMLHKAAGTPYQFNELIVDVFALRPPDLFIMDAVTGMEGNGPVSTELRHIGRVLASDNAVALDAVVARMMGVEPSLLRFMQIASERGLGSFDQADIEIIGELQALPDFKLPPMPRASFGQTDTMEELIVSRILLRPVADPDSCTGCGTCVEHCPASALSMPEDVPVVDKDRCITCFCCQEICPEKAITLQ